LVKTNDVDTGATPLASEVITHPLVAVNTAVKASPTSVNVMEAPPLSVSGVIIAFPPPSTSKTTVTLCPATPSASAGVAAVEGVVTSIRPPVAVTADVAAVYA
jgi:hypothetical protein